MNAFRLGPAISLISLALSGCGTLEHAKGRLLVETGRTVDGVQSLEKATRLAPTDPAFKVDYLHQREEIARGLLKEAERLRARGELTEAAAAFEQVLSVDRGNVRALAGLSAQTQDLRNVQLLADAEDMLAQGKVDIALDRARRVLQSHPQNERAARLENLALDARAREEAAASRKAVAKGLMERPVTLQFNNAPLRMVFEAVARSGDLNILLDREIKASNTVTIFVKDIPTGDALDFILMQNQLERSTINANTVVIYPSTEAKKAEYEDLTIRSFQVTNVDVKYMSNLLKTMLKIRDVSADERSGILVVRDTPEKIKLASRLMSIHDVPDPEIMLEVEIMEVSSTRRSNLGIDPPTAFTIATPSSQAALTIGALKQLRANDLLATPLSLTLNFKLEDQDARLLASPRIRARNKEKARIMIGDRVPTVSNSVTPLASGNAVITGNVSYQEVGLKLEFEPQVHANQEVGIRISLEVSNIAAEFTDPQGGRSYQIGTRNASTTLRLRDGETQILGGLITDDDRNTASKIPGVGHLPVVGRLFGSNNGTSTQSEILLAITPRIVRDLASAAADTRGIFSGTLNLPRERPIVAESAGVPKAALAGANTMSPSPAGPGSTGIAPVVNSTTATATPAAPMPIESTITPPALLPVPPPKAVRPQPAK